MRAGGRNISLLTTRDKVSHHCQKQEGRLILDKGARVMGCGKEGRKSSTSTTAHWLEEATSRATADGDGKHGLKARHAATTRGLEKHYDRMHKKRNYQQPHIMHQTSTARVYSPPSTRTDRDPFHQNASNHDGDSQNKWLKALHSVDASASRRGRAASLCLSSWLSPRRDSRAPRYQAYSYHSGTPTA